jgi:O-antigen/teichoic acid export membrane protein
MKLSHALQYSSQIINSAISIAISIFLAKCFDKQEVGQYLYYFTTALLITGFLTAPLGIWLTRSRGNEQIENTIIKIWIYVSLLIGFIYLAIYFIVSNKLQSNAMAAGALLATLTLFSYKWNSDGKRVKYSIGLLTPTLLRFLLFYFALIYFNEIKAGDLLILTNASLASALLIAILMEPNTKIKQIIFNKSTKNQLKIIKEGLPLLLGMMTSSAVFILYQIADRIIIKYHHGYAAVAELVFAMQWSHILITTAIQPFMIIILPKILQNNEHKSKIITFQALKVLATLIILSSAAVMSLSDKIKIIVPDNYFNVIEVLPIGILSGGLFSMGQLISINFSRSGSEKFHLLSILAPSVLSVLFMIMWVENFKLVGVMGAHLLFGVIYFATCLNLLKKL